MDFVSSNTAAGADGQVLRVAHKLGLIAVAGEMATGWAITPWRSGEATAAAASVLKAWVEGRGGEGAAEVREAINRVRMTIEAHGSSRFEREDDVDARPVNNRLGYTKGSGTEQVWLIPPSIWKAEICAGLDPKSVASILAANNMIDPGSDGNQKVVYAKGRSSRYYVVTAKILEAGA